MIQAMQPPVPGYLHTYGRAVERRIVGDRWGSSPPALASQSPVMWGQELGFPTLHVRLSLCLKGPCHIVKACKTEWISMA
ncbi:MAG TPA: hypothetical protein VGF44_03345 [Terriglobales bacterium]